MKIELITKYLSFIVLCCCLWVFTANAEEFSDGTVLTIDSISDSFVNSDLAAGGGYIDEDEITNIVSKYTEPFTPDEKARLESLEPATHKVAEWFELAQKCIGLLWIFIISTWFLENLRRAYMRWVKDIKETTNESFFAVNFAVFFLPLKIDMVDIFFIWFLNAAAALIFIVLPVEFLIYIAVVATLVISGLLHKKLYKNKKVLMDRIVELENSK